MSCSIVVLKMVVASAVEAEVASLSHAAQTIVPLRVIVDTLGHKQLAIPLRTDNNTASGIMNSMIIQQQTKAIVI